MTSGTMIVLDQATNDSIAAQFAAMPLDRLVAAVVAELTQRGRAFTAYDVTMYLRQVFPLGVRDLPHYDDAATGTRGCQPEVHRQMQAYLQNNTYATTRAYPNGTDAVILYKPMQVQTRATPQPQVTAAPSTSRAPRVAAAAQAPTTKAKVLLPGGWDVTDAQ